MRPRRWAVNAFIVVYVAGVVAASMPAPAQRPPLRYLRILLQPIMMRAGLGQRWDMFAKPPSTLDSFEARVRLADGTEALWTFPRMETLGYFERYRQERSRKWIERVRAEENRAAWPDTARFVARQVSRPDNPAREVALVHRWSQIPEPRGPRLAPRLHTATFSEDSVFFRYPVKPGDLP